MIRLIDTQLLDAVSREAQASPRRRKNRNLHPTDDFPAHRLLNAIEPDSYIAPHRHLDPRKDETMIVLRGSLGLVIFDDAGVVTQTALLAANGASCGVDIPHGTWHTLVAIEPATVFLEAKAGPYLALTPEERATWAPAEGDKAAAAFLEKLRGLFNA
ncbi:MAG: WbuC family cupin fold metalloprotein [Betaproteobacteria bacterium]|nr:WbuC family cupin fold metalloprotein [Betaproteobacteria bacterium]